MNVLVLHYHSTSSDTLGTLYWCVCACVCVCVCHVHACIHVVSVCVCVYVYNVNVCVCVRVCVSVTVCVWVCITACVCFLFSTFKSFFLCLFSRPQKQFSLVQKRPKNMGWKFPWRRNSSGVSMVLCIHALAVTDESFLTKSRGTMRNDE